MRWTMGRFTRGRPGRLRLASDHPFGFEKGGVFLIGPQDMLVEPVFQEIGNLDGAGNG